MDTNGLVVLKLFLFGILVNTLMTRGLSATESFNVESLPRMVVRLSLCNETQLLSGVEGCGEGFKREMDHVDQQNRCNLTNFINEYHLFTHCMETNALIANCYWPNPLVEGYIIRIHKLFFSNCTLERVIWVDPPDDTLTVLILIPVFLTLAMIGLVVWCSKRGDIMA